MAYRGRYAPRLYTSDDGWTPMQIWGMGIASQDVTGDGLPEVFLTSQGDNKLQTLDDGAAGPSYVDIAIRRGVTAHRPFTEEAVLPSTAWHPEFQDVNNDGFVDLYISKGNVDAMVEYAIDDPGNLLLGQPDGTFVEGAIDAGIVNLLRTRARRWRTSISMVCSISSKSTDAKTSRCGATWAARRWATGSHWISCSQVPTSMGSVLGSRSIWEIGSPCGN